MRSKGKVCFERPHDASQAGHAGLQRRPALGVVLGRWRPRLLGHEGESRVCGLVLTLNSHFEILTLNSHFAVQVEIRIAVFARI